MHAPATPSPDLERQTLEVGFRQGVAAMRRTLVTTPAGWLLVLWICWDAVPRDRLLLWLAAFAATWAVNHWVLHTVVRQGAEPTRHHRAVQGVAIVDGLGWGLLFALGAGHGPVTDAWLAAVLAGVGAVNAPVYITLPRCFRAQIGSMWALSMLALTGDHDALLPAGAGLTVFFGLLTFYMRSIAERIIDGIRLQLANADLAERLARALSQVQHDAATDVLTALPNRRSVEALLQRHTAADDAAQPPLCVLMVDIDHFKRINDDHGHAVGDAALRAFADRVRALLRAGDVCGRYGGEEFVVVLPGTDLPRALEVAERLRAGCALQPLPTTPPQPFTVSIGVAERRPGDTSASMIERADAALYAAKRAGRDRVRAPDDDATPAGATPSPALRPLRDDALLTG